MGWLNPYSEDGIREANIEKTHLENSLEEEWNGGAIVAVIWVVLYFLTTLIIVALPYTFPFPITVDPSFNTGKVFIALGGFGMAKTYRKFREKQYEIATRYYLVSLIPALLFFEDGFISAMLLTIFALPTMLKSRDKK